MEAAKTMNEEGQAAVACSIESEAERSAKARRRFHDESIV